jgi:hypothetical protein
MQLCPSHWDGVPHFRSFAFPSLCPSPWDGVSQFLVRGFVFWARTKRHALVLKLMQPLAGGVLADTKILGATLENKERPRAPTDIAFQAADLIVCLNRATKGGSLPYQRAPTTSIMSRANTVCYSSAGLEVRPPSATPLAIQEVKRNFSDTTRFIVSKPHLM